MAVNSFREDEYMENTDKKKILSRLLSYLLDYKLAIAGVLVCMGITVGISLVNPLLTDRIYTSISRRYLSRFLTADRPEKFLQESSEMSIH